MIKYKMNVLAALKEKGYNQTRILKENILSQSVVQSLRAEKPITTRTLDKLCKLLECQLTDIVEFVLEE